MQAVKPNETYCKTLNWSSPWGCISSCVSVITSVDLKGGHTHCLWMCVRLVRPAGKRKTTVLTLQKNMLVWFQEGHLTCFCVGVCGRVCVHACVCVLAVLYFGQKKRWQGACVLCPASSSLSDWFDCRFDHFLGFLWSRIDSNGAAVLEKLAMEIQSCVTTFCYIKTVQTIILFILWTPLHVHQVVWYFYNLSAIIFLLCLCVHSGSGQLISSFTALIGHLMPIWSCDVCVSLWEQCLDASRPWLCFWILHSLELLEEPIPAAVASEWVTQTYTNTHTHTHTHLDCTTKHYQGALMEPDKACAVPRTFLLFISIKLDS